MGHCTPPAFWMPNHAGRLSSQFGMSIDTASPFCEAVGDEGVRDPVRARIDLAVATATRPSPNRR